MRFLINFLPILLFITLYVGSGIYFAITGVENAFYQISPTVAIIPALALGWMLHKGPTSERMHSFLGGVAHRDIITMCIIFLLAGAFSAVTKAIGSVDSTVNFALSIMPAKLLLIGIFITAAFISTAIGTSMGTIATVAPIAAGLADQGAFSAALAMATVVGGAMFGDNLSVISDTTIASVMSQEANMRAKLKINAIIASFASIATILVLFFMHSSAVEISPQDYSLILISPYIFLVALAVAGINVFVVLITSLVFAGVIGYFFNSDYSILALSQDIAEGFSGMQEIMLLSLMVGGLSGLAGEGSKGLATYLGHVISKGGSKRIAQLFIAKIVSVFDILLANNTVAIIFSGEIARDIAKKYRIPPHYSAVWLDIFSCTFQGLIPYGAQILLASSIAGISPISITPYVYYCYALGVVGILYILLKRQL